MGILVDFPGQPLRGVRSLFLASFAKEMQFWGLTGEPEIWRTGEPEKRFATTLPAYNEQLPIKRILNTESETAQPNPSLLSKYAIGIGLDTYTIWPIPLQRLRRVLDSRFCDDDQLGARVTSYPYISLQTPSDHSRHLPANLKSAFGTRILGHWQLLQKRCLPASAVDVVRVLRALFSMDQRVVLFRQLDGSPLSFHMSNIARDPSYAAERSRMENLIKSHGGEFVRVDFLGEKRILVRPEDKEMTLENLKAGKDSSPYLLTTYIDNCVAQRQLLVDIPYRVHLPPPARKRAYSHYLPREDAAISDYVKCHRRGGNLTSRNFWKQAHRELGGEVAERHSWSSLKERFQKKLKLSLAEKPEERVKGGEGGAELAREGGGNGVSNRDERSANVLVTREGGVVGVGEVGAMGRVLPDYVPVPRGEEAEKREGEGKKVDDSAEWGQGPRNGGARWVDTASTDQLREGIFYLQTLSGASEAEVRLALEESGNLWEVEACLLHVSHTDVTAAVEWTVAEEALIRSLMDGGPIGEDVRKECALLVERHGLGSMEHGVHLLGLE